MFTRKKIVIACFLALFGLQEIAYAASISTRVRILESKVAKQDRVMKSLQSNYQSQAKEVKSELSKIRALENKVDQLIKAQEGKNKRKHLTDKRYAYP